VSMNRNEGRFSAPPSSQAPPEVLEQIQNLEADAHVKEQAPSSDAGLFSFTTPTEFVELPSRGRFYPESHPLHNSETIEIKYMTAKDEDILTSPALLRKGLAIDRMIQNIIVDKRIKSDSLLVGDKSAIVVAARASGYGSDYVTNVTCPRCGTTSDFAFDLGDAKIQHGGADLLREEGHDVKETPQGTFMLTLPRMKVEIEVKLLTGKEEKFISKLLSSKKQEEQLLTSQLKTFIVSANGHTDRRAIDHLVHNMPAQDSRFLRGVYQKLAPNVDLTQDYSCGHCGYEQEMEVPFGADFFWPKS